MCQPANNKEKSDRKKGVYGVLPYMAPRDGNAVKICKGPRPKVFEGIPKFLVDLIMKCLDAKAENRQSAKELYQILEKWEEIEHDDNENYSQMDEYYKKIREKKLKTKSNENKSESIKTHPQAIYTSRLLNFKNLPEPVNSSDLSSFQINSDDVPSVSTNITIYTSRLLNFKNLPEPVNSSYLSSFQDDVPSVSANLK
ncbi:hypothetical protein RhiirA1_469735 [Rhizophagus irregularis]|uniref:Protein kinase domain-containing protein n=1 Tax=Rhizophagus irregularis TaxID=588596 RepID=A0A2N0R7H3_9GLOM|nr:hypothetical protein RhiirA1_469735 [Rhizophagus irregularis]